MDCCLEFAIPGEGASPFRENIVLGYYDGPTGGLLRCQKCGRAYYYMMVAWDDGQDVRVYALWAFPLESFARMEQLLATRGAPKYPDWVAPWNGSIDEQGKQIDHLLSGAAARGSDAVYLVKGETPTGRIRARSVDGAIREALTARDSHSNEIDDIAHWSVHFDHP